MRRRNIIDVGVQTQVGLGSKKIFIVKIKVLKF